jgi:hypothetical protein
MTNAERLGKLIEARSLILEVKKDVIFSDNNEEVSPSEFIHTTMALKQLISRFTIVRAGEMAKGMGVEL